MWWTPDFSTKRPERHMHSGVSLPLAGLLKRTSGSTHNSSLPTESCRSGLKSFTSLLSILAPHILHTASSECSEPRNTAVTCRQCQRPAAESCTDRTLLLKASSLLKSSINQSIDFLRPWRASKAHRTSIMYANGAVRLCGKLGKYQPHMSACVY